MVGACVITYGKFQPSGISGIKLVTFSRDLPRDARRLELSICFHTPTSHFRTPFLLSLYHHHLIYTLS